jgi:hypothetical protein
MPTTWCPLFPGRRKLFVYHTEVWYVYVHTHQFVWYDGDAIEVLGMILVFGLYRTPERHHGSVWLIFLNEVLSFGESNLVAKIAVLLSVPDKEPLLSCIGHVPSYEEGCGPLSSLD